MSWRETLGVVLRTPEPATQNAHNTQKSTVRGNCANCAHSAHDISEQHSQLMEALAQAGVVLQITPEVVCAALDDGDIEDWRSGQISNELLVALARVVVERRLMDQGKRPSYYTARAMCRQCGPIWFWRPATVDGCPWCWNRVNGAPIPRPTMVHCGDCIHFRRVHDHPHLGHCDMGQPEAPAGLWDTDVRRCDRYMPHARPERVDEEMDAGSGQTEIPRNTSTVLTNDFGKMRRE